MPWKQDDTSEDPSSLDLFCPHRSVSFSADDEAVVEVNIPGSESSEAILRKRTAGILDMGGVSTQIAYEVPKTVSFASSQQVLSVQVSFFLIWFHLTCFRPFLLFSESEHIFTVLAEVLPSQPGESRQEEAKAKLP